MGENWILAEVTARSHDSRHCKEAVSGEFGVQRKSGMEIRRTRARAHNHTHTHTIVLMNSVTTQFKDVNTRVALLYNGRDL